MLGLGRRLRAGQLCIKLHICTRTADPRPAPPCAAGPALRTLLAPAILHRHLHACSCLRLQDPSRIKDLAGGARGIDNLLYRWGGTMLVVVPHAAPYRRASAGRTPDPPQRCPGRPGMAQARGASPPSPLPADM